MKPAELSVKLIERFPSLTRPAADIKSLGEWYSSLKIEPLLQGDQSVRGLSWRCRAVATSNLLRGEEFLRFSVLALNEGAVLSAYTLIRGLFETLAAVVFTRLKIERGIRSNDPVSLTDTLNRLTCGNRYLATKDPKYPKSYNVLTMIDEAAAYLDREYLPANLADKKGGFRDDYDLKSEFVHPAIGSFKAYQRWHPDDGCFHWTREEMGEELIIGQALSALLMAGHLLLTEACILHAVCDLPGSWPKTTAPSSKSEGSSPEV
jgi:hypothetical protein